MPAHSRFNASRLNLRTAVHDSVRRGWLTLHRAELSSANNAPVYPGAQGGYTMSFSGLRAIILLAVLISLVLAVSRLGLPGWIVPVGLLVTGVVLKKSEKAASN
jgi:hypothetical protein